jgi:hypothetical protein
MKKMGYVYTDSLLYKIKHNEMIRLSKVAIHTTKNEGISTLFRAIKGKFQRNFLVKIKHHEPKNDLM